MGPGNPSVQAIHIQVGGNKHLPRPRCSHAAVEISMYGLLIQCDYSNETVPELPLVVTCIRVFEYHPFPVYYAGQSINGEEPVICTWILSSLTP